MDLEKRDNPYFPAIFIAFQLHEKCMEYMKKHRLTLTKKLKYLVCIHLAKILSKESGKNIEVEQVVRWLKRYRRWYEVNKSRLEG
jgi:hypothetical protein